MLPIFSMAWFGIGVRMVSIAGMKDRTKIWHLELINPLLDGVEGLGTNAARERVQWVGAIWRSAAPSETICSGVSDTYRSESYRSETAQTGAGEMYRSETPIYRSKTPRNGAHTYRRGSQTYQGDGTSEAEAKPYQGEGGSQTYWSDGGSQTYRSGAGNQTYQSDGGSEAGLSVPRSKTYRSETARNAGSDCPKPDVLHATETYRSQSRSQSRPRSAVSGTYTAGSKTYRSEGSYHSGSKTYCTHGSDTYRESESRAETPRPDTYTNTESETYRAASGSEGGASGFINQLYPRDLDAETVTGQSPSSHAKVVLKALLAKVAPKADTLKVRPLTLRARAPTSAGRRHTKIHKHIHRCILKIQAPTFLPTSTLKKALKTIPKKMTHTP
ncbi:hypothetical protein RSOL_558570, partial [Rhizoctonia solani AG-3 Rhs1AP]